MLLSTYNGAAFLPRQWESLCEQTFTDWTLLVRDDGSTDGTLDLIRSFAARDSRVRLVPPDGERMGPAQSFGRLLVLANESPYIALCDQDDVWLPHKLEGSLARIQQKEAEFGTHTPCLIHTDLTLVDADLHLLATSAKRHLGFDHSGHTTFAQLLAQNVVTGCTVLCNRSLLQAALPLPAAVLMHDWWLALIAAARGQIIYWDEATVLYRQHGRNASGSARRKSLASAFSEFVAQFAQFQELMRRRFRQNEALRDRLASGPACAARDLLESWLSAQAEGRISGASEAWKRGVRMQGMARTLAFYALLLKDGYPNHDSGCKS